MAEMGGTGGSGECSLEGPRNLNVSAVPFDVTSGPDTGVPLMITLPLLWSLNCTLL